MQVSEQNLDWPSANRKVNYSSLAMMRTVIAQAGIKNINERERKCTSASPRASQVIADGHFVHS